MDDFAADIIRLQKLIEIEALPPVGRDRLEAVGIDRNHERMNIGKFVSQTLIDVLQLLDFVGDVHARLERRPTRIDHQLKDFTVMDGDIDPLSRIAAPENKESMMRRDHFCAYRMNLTDYVAPHH